MSTKFLMTRDLSGTNGFGLQFSDQNYSATLSAASNTTLVCPSDGSIGGSFATKTSKYLAIFSYEAGASIWVALNATAAVPVGHTFAAVTSTLNPTARVVNAGDTLNFITSDTGTPQVGVTFYVLG